MAHPQEFRCLLSGAGGTLSINKHEDVKAIGAYGCEDSLGVYIPINSERAFCAHMVVRNIPFILSVEQGERLTKDVCQRLTNLAKREKWNPLDDQFAERIVMVCRYPTREIKGGVSKNVGWYMVRGVQEFVTKWCVGEMMAVLNGRPNPAVKLGVIPSPSDPNLSKADQETLHIYHRIMKVSSAKLQVEESEEAHGFVVDSHVASEPVILVPDRRDEDAQDRRRHINATYGGGSFLFGKYPNVSGKAEVYSLYKPNVSHLDP